jgi:hypothetical protein
MNDEEQRFIAETGEEAHYWFTVSDVARLSVEQGLAKVLSDVIELMHKEKMKGAISG